MTLLLLAAALLQAAPEGDLIVVTAHAKKCDITLADRVLSDPEFAARAAEWRAGRPVRIYAPPGTDYKCLAKIMDKLGAKGVVRARFVDSPDAP